MLALESDAGNWVAGGLRLAWRTHRECTCLILRDFAFAPDGRKRALVTIGASEPDFGHDNGLEWER